jgi:hypothetical protein
MIIRTIFRGGKYTRVEKSVLYLILVGVALIVFFSIAWVYQKIKFDVGVNVADIGLTFAMVFCFWLVLTGMRMGYFIDMGIRKRSFIFLAPPTGGWVDTLIRIWGFEPIDGEKEIPTISESTHTPEEDNVLENMNKPRRRGRKPTFPIDRWRRVVLKWENRNTLRDTMTLAEVLSKEFGTNVDGSPRMAEQSYYVWRDRVFAEIKKEAEAKYPPAIFPKAKSNGK